MHRRWGLSAIVLMLLVALLTACGGSAATDTPNAAPPTIAAPTIAPTTAAASVPVAGTRPVGSAATGSSVAATFAPPTAAGSASVAATIRPASPAAGSASAVAGTRPVGSATTGSVIAGSTAPTGSTTTGAALTPFADPQGRFSFSRPAAWTVGPSTATNSVVQFSSTNPLGVIDISTESVAGGTTPDAYLDAAFAEITKAIPDARQIGRTSLRLGSEPALQIDYTGTVNGHTVYFSQIFALHTGTAYVLTLGTQPTDSDAMKRQALPVIQTWKFLQ